MNCDSSFSKIVFIGIVIFENQFLHSIATYSEDLEEALVDSNTIYATQKQFFVKGGTKTSRRKIIKKKVHFNSFKSRASSRSLGYGVDRLEDCQPSPVKSGIYFSTIHCSLSSKN